MTKTIGVILIVLGLFGLAWGGFSYVTRETVVDIGPIHATREQTHNVPVPPIAGALALIGGIVLLAVGGKE
jgi:drug/metabolite transporter (DMT)-like permease